MLTTNELAPVNFTYTRPATGTVCCRQLMMIVVTLIMVIIIMMRRPAPVIIVPITVVIGKHETSREQRTQGAQQQYKLQHRPF